MGRRYTAMVAIIVLWGLAGCDPLEPDDDAGTPVTDVSDPDAEPDTGADAGPTPMDAGPAVDAAPGDGSTDAVSADAGDAMRDALSDDMRPDGLAPDAGPDMTPADARPDNTVDAQPIEPDLGPDLGLICMDDDDCDGVCDGGRCRPCAAGGACPGGRCDDGICLGCRDRADCGGSICEAGRCRPCRARDECGGALCIDGICAPCMDSAACGDEVCVDGLCTICNPDGHEGCGDDELCCGAGDAVGCVATDPAVQCGACGEACDPEASDACIDRACGCGLGDACAAAEPYCVDGPAEGVCVACRAAADCAPGFICLEGGGCGPATVIDALAADPELEAMLEFVGIAGLEDDLRDREAVTLFAPDNEAFGSLSGGCINTIVVGGQTFIRHHTLRSREVLTRDLLVETADAVPDGVPLLMESNDEAVVARQDGGPVVVDGLPLLRSIDAGNGVVHVLGQRILLTEPYAAGCEPAR